MVSLCAPCARRVRDISMCVPAMQAPYAHQHAVCTPRVRMRTIYHQAHHTRIICTPHTHRRHTRTLCASCPRHVRTECAPYAHHTCPICTPFAHHAHQMRHMHTVCAPYAYHTHTMCFARATYAHQMLTIPNHMRAIHTRYACNVHHMMSAVCAPHAHHSRAIYACPICTICCTACAQRRARVKRAQHAPLRVPYTCQTPYWKIIRKAIKINRKQSN